MKDEIRYIPIQTQYEEDQETLGNLIWKIKNLFLPDDEPEKIFQINDQNE